MIAGVLHKLTLLVLTFGLPLVVACGTTSTPTSAPAAPPAPAGTTPTSAGLASTPVATPGSPSTSPAAASLVVSLDDNRQTLDVRVGDRVLLQLGEDRDWTVNVDNPSVLSRVPNVALIRGAQGLYTVQAPGQAVLTADGKASCPAGVACPANVLHFQVTLVAH